MIFRAFSDGRFDLGGRWSRCALGRGGTICAEDKREGDGCSPMGRWPIREALYRQDRLSLPAVALRTRALQRQDGWCDAPHDPAYNRPVLHPYSASAEHLWREDELYDVILVLGYNDDPVVAGNGSAIFLHLARLDFSPTEGCVALEKGDALELLRLAAPGDLIAIEHP